MFLLNRMLYGFMDSASLNVPGRHSQEICKNTEMENGNMLIIIGSNGDW
jgi:hypothetical protein